MERIIFNDDNLTNEEINDRAMKSRAIMVNDAGEILLCKYANMYFLPGGKIDDERSMCSGLEVEIKEETGISIDLSNGKPFLLVQQCVRNYPKRDNQGFANRLSETYYFIVKSNEEVKLEEMALTEKEKAGGFSIIRIHPNNICGLLAQHTTDNPRNAFFARELMAVIEKYKQILPKEAPRLITSWEELLSLPANEKCKIVEKENGAVWIMPSNDDEEMDFGVNCEYLSTHLFYGSSYQQSTETLQKFGFNVEIDNWDKDTEKPMVLNKKNKKRKK